jgi:hypothetical protein
LKQGTGTFGLEPPPEMNLDAGMPITKAKELQEGLRRYTEYRRRLPGGGTPDVNSTAATPPQGPELVRLDAIPEGAKVPPTGALPEMPVATPLAVHGKPKRATPPPVVAMNTTPRRTATPPPPPPLATTPRPIPQPEPSSEPPSTPVPRTSPQGVPLTPFIASNPAPGLPSANGSTWRTYAAGRLPPGRTMTPHEAGDLADRGDLGERIYLRGQFVVTAAGENKAVLRPQGAVADPSKPVAGATRIIVEYPSGAVPPSEGSAFARDESRPFEVRDVRRGADGQINIYVREITAP